MLLVSKKLKVVIHLNYCTSNFENQKKNKLIIRFICVYINCDVYDNFEYNRVYLEAFIFTIVKLQ